VVVPFEATSILILIAILGANAVLAKRECDTRRSTVVPISYYITLSAILFGLGVAGFRVQRNIITIFMPSS